MTGFEGLLTEAWQARSDAQDSGFGNAVASGDVNGDGYDDVIVGARYDHEAGRTYLYLGSAAGLDASPAWVGQGFVDGDSFGRAVAAGDVDGDGFDDLIVGASLAGYDGYGSSGFVYVFHGSADGVTAESPWILAAQYGDVFFGAAVSSGDVNGDGFGDVVVGAYGYPGSVSVYRGSATGPAPYPIVELGGESLTDDQFGYALDAAGDLNGDGFDDIAVGAPRASVGTYSEGSVSVYFGAEPGPSPEVEWTAASNRAVALYGLSLATGGDVDGDGYDDLVVGAPYLLDQVVEGSGGAFVYLGSPSGLTTDAVWTVGPAGEGAYNLAWGVSFADVNGDGFSDVVVGDPVAQDGPFPKARVSAYLGSRLGVSPFSTTTAASEEQGSDWIYSLASAGDVDGDGDHEVVVGSWYGWPRGDATVYLGAPLFDADIDGIADHLDACQGNNASGDSDLDGACRLDVSGDTMDCDDHDPARFPGAVEECNGVDDSCAGATSPFEVDLDEDGVRGCEGDCDDADAAVLPGAEEICDGFDNNCDGAIDGSDCRNEPRHAETSEAEGGCGCQSAAAPSWLFGLVSLLARGRGGRSGRRTSPSRRCSSHSA